MQATFTHNGQTIDLSPDEWLGKIAEIGCKGVIFDCDGTLVESSEAHCRSMQAAAAEQGCDMTTDWYATRTGLDRRTLFEEFSETVGPGFDLDQAIQTSISSYAGFLDLVHPIEDISALFWGLRNQGYPLAVATNAEREIAVQSLEVIGVSEALDALVTISEVALPKPAPALFQAAASALGLRSNEVCVIEDSPQGVKAAVTAGMAVFRVATNP